MPLLAKVQNVLCELKIRALQESAKMQQTTLHFRRTPALGIPFALAFVMMLTAIAAPAHAVDVDLNATIGPILESVSDLIPTIIQLMVDIVPAILVGSVIGFICGFFGKILGMFDRI